MGKVLVLDSTQIADPHHGNVKAPHAIFYRKDLKKLFIVGRRCFAVKFTTVIAKTLRRDQSSVDADSSLMIRLRTMYVVNGGREAHYAVFADQRRGYEQLEEAARYQINSNHVEAIVLRKRRRAFL